MTNNNKRVENRIHLECSKFGFDMAKIEKKENGLLIGLDWDEDISYLDPDHREGIFNFIESYRSKLVEEIEKYSQKQIQAITEYKINLIEDITSRAVRVNTLFSLVE